MAVKYHRVLLKLSGEALSGEKGFGLDVDTIQKICSGIQKAHELGAEIAIVVGGGNFWRGRASGEMERTRADQIGMLATAMNALAVADALEHLGPYSACADSAEHAAGGRALYPQPRHTPSGEGAHRDFCLRHGQPLFFHRHGLGAACGRDQMPILFSKPPWWTVYMIKTRKSIPMRRSMTG